MPIVWPPTVPQAPDFAWSDSKLENVVETQTDGGPKKRRRRYTRAVEKLSLPITLTQSQVSTLKTFHTTTLKDGILPFEMVHPRTGLTHEFTWTSPWSVSEVSRGLYRINIELEYLP
jgi:hypothetical protein